MHINVTWLNYMEMHVSRFTQLMMLSSQIELAGAVAKKNTNTQGKDCPIFNNKCYDLKQVLGNFFNPCSNWLNFQGNLVLEKVLEFSSKEYFNKESHVSESPF